MALNKVLTLTLAAASANNIAVSQTIGGAGNFTLNGSAVSGGVATLDVPRRVLITSAGNDTGKTFTVVGTGQNGLSQTETVAGATGAVSTTRDFKTVTRVSISAAAAAAVTVGTNSVASTTPANIDAYINPASIGVDTTVTGTVNYTIEFTTEDLSPLWDLNSYTPTWFSVFGFDSVTTNLFGKLDQPATLVRLTINSGSGTVVARVRQNFIAGRA